MWPALMQDAGRSETASHRLAHAGVAGVLLIAAAATFMTRGVFVHHFLNDYLFVGESAWRIASGQVPHLDFHSALGQAFYWAFGVFGLFGTPHALTLLHANLLAALLVAAGAVLVLPRRLSPLLYLLTTAAIVALTVAARDADMIMRFSFAGMYNRWSWALFSLAALIALVPPRDGQTRPILDGIVLGVAASLLAYLKVTFALGAGLLVVLGLVVRHLELKPLFVAAATGLMVVLVVQLSFGNNFAYLEDVRTAARVGAEQHGSRFGWKLPRMAPLFVVYVGGMLALTLLWKPAGVNWLRTWARSLLLAAGVVGIGAVIAYQNMHNREVAHYVVAAIILAELGRRAGAGNATKSMIGRLAWPGLIVATAAFTLLDLGSLVAHAAITRGTTVCSIPELRGTPYKGILQTPAAIRGALLGERSGEDCAAVRPAPAAYRPQPDTEMPGLKIPVMAQGLSLLRVHARPEDRIFTMQISSLYPALLGTPPIRDTLAWWDPERSFSVAVHPGPHELLDEATLVLQSTAPRSANLFGDYMWGIYGPYVRAHFEPVAETGSWVLWRRRDGQAIASR
jgi:hypothetical protein